jgi:hypothetical protein
MAWNYSEIDACEAARSEWLKLPREEQDRLTWDDVWKLKLIAKDTMEIAQWVGLRKWHEERGHSAADALRALAEHEAVQR